ncbi:MAG: FecR domain-containing protein [Bdellovibrionales bacterium]|nr:FecR domain-containing protein [Bdellovibrionales bacterium]
MVRFLLFALSLSLSATSYASECGLFRVVKGKVEYQKKSQKKFLKARINKKICAGDLVKTSDRARTKIVMADGNEINVSPATELVIEVYEKNAATQEKKVLLNVLYGKIRSNVKQKYKDTDKNHYRVKTKSAVAGVRGTEFMASFDQRSSQSRFVTFEGVVAVGKFEGGNFVPKVEVKPGQFTSNDVKSEPHPAKDLPPQEFAQLDRETNVDSAAGDRGVSNDVKPEAEKKKEPKDEPKADDQGNDDKPPKKENNPKKDGNAKKEPAPKKHLVGDKNGNKPPSDDGRDQNSGGNKGGGDPMFADGSRDPASIDGGSDNPDFGDPTNDPVLNDPSADGIKGDRDIAYVDDSVDIGLPEPELDTAGGGDLYQDVNIKPPPLITNTNDIVSNIPETSTTVNNIIQNKNVRLILNVTVGQ